MKQERDYYQDITEIRSMMERSSKFLSLSGWAGILAGIYALAAAFIAYWYLDFHPYGFIYSEASSIDPPFGIKNIILLGLITFALAIGTAVWFSWKRANRRGEKLWNPTSKRVLEHMLIPLLVGGLLIVILISKGLFGLLAPLSLLFYGFALYNTSKFTYEEVKVLGFVQLVLGLFGSYFTEYGLLFWALGFGVAHIIYGIYLYIKYER